MAATVANRKDVRSAFQTLLSSLVGDGKVAQFGYGYKKADFSQQSPGYTLASHGSNRSNPAHLSPNSDVFLSVHLFSVYMTINESSGAEVWTEEESEDKLDDLEAAVVGVIEDNEYPAESAGLPWTHLWITDRSTVDEVFVGGWLYRHEEISVQFTAPNPS